MLEIDKHWPGIKVLFIQNIVFIHSHFYSYPQSQGSVERVNYEIKKKLYSWMSDKSTTESRKE